MSGWTKGIAVALLHMLIVCSLGAKLLYDRATRPRVWVSTGSIDPDLPIRGRYMTLRLQAQAPWFKPDTNGYATDQVRLAVENNSLVAYKSDKETGLTISTWQGRRNPNITFLDQPVAFFLPEHADLPRLKPGDEIWAEVTVPKKGPPRPIQLAVKHGAEWKPLNYR
jgi:hypothetical protein